MAHEWQVNRSIRRRDDKIPYSCRKCGSMIAQDPDAGPPNPEHVFWRNNEEIGTCEYLQVLYVMFA